MANTAFTETEKISKIHSVLEDVKDISVVSYIFFSLVLNYGFKQNDLLDSTFDDIFCVNISKKYPDIDLSNSELINLVPYESRCETFRSLLPTRDYLHKMLNRCAREEGFVETLNVSNLQKTWAYTELAKGGSINAVMSHFSYRNSSFRFLTEFLGLPFGVCVSSGSYLLNIYARSCFSELTHMDYEHFSEEQQLEFLNLLHRILNLFDFLKQ